MGTLKYPAPWKILILLQTLQGQDCIVAAFRKASTLIFLVTEVSDTGSAKVIVSLLAHQC